MPITNNNQSTLCAALLIMLAGSAHAQMSITSTSIAEGGELPLEHVADQFGCSGGNLSPHLSWGNVPNGTKSFIVLAFDPDAPTASGWWHWGAYDINPSVFDLPVGAGGMASNSDINMKRTKNDFGAFGYIGACPPEGGGSHRYQFMVYALPLEKLPVGQSVSPAMLSFFGENLALDSATLTVTYER